MNLQIVENLAIHLMSCESLREEIQKKNSTFISYKALAVATTKAI